MRTLIACGAALLVFVLALVSDYLETRYVTAVGRRDATRAARYSVAMWLVGVIGLVTVLEVGWWVIAPEGAGLYLGTLWAMKDAEPREQPPALRVVHRQQTHGCSPGSPGNTQDPDVKHDIATNPVGQVSSCTGSR